MELRPMMSALWRNRTGPLLVAIQVAIALTVLVNAAYVIQQRIAATQRPTGIDIDNIFWLRSDGYTAQYNHPLTVQGDLQYLNALPGVVAAAISHGLPQTFSSTSLPFSTDPDSKKREGGILYLSSERFAETLGLKLSAGRFPSADAVQTPQADMNAAFAAWSPEVVITKALADKVFPNGDALGETLFAGLINRSAQVVGIVERMQAMPITGPFASVTEQIVLVPGIPPGPSALYLVRTEPGRRDEVMARVEREFEPLQPGRFLNRMQSMTDTAAQTRAPARTTSVMLAVVACFVLMVTAIGIFGLTAFNVTNRTKQVGTRRAIGARRRDILRYFLVENWLVTTFGIIVGCVAALALGIQLSRALQLPRMPLYFLIAGVVGLWLLGLFAALMPARRAAAVSPAIATRTV